MLSLTVARALPTPRSGSGRGPVVRAETTAAGATHRHGPVRCRTIAEADLDAVIALLQEGFPDRTEAYWRQGLARHKARARPEGYPDFGYLLEHASRPVGVLLTLFTRVTQDGRSTVRCNLSSWYVEPPYRAHGSLLEAVASRRSEVTYLNVTPAPHTWAIQEARGFQRYCRGQMFVLPILSRAAGRTVEELADADTLADFDPFERDLLRDHRAYGCVVLLGREVDGTRRPFVLQRRTVGLLPNNKAVGRVACVQVMYCRSTEEVARFAGAIGRLLLRRHRMPCMVVDADRPIPGLVGWYFEGRAPKYVRGPDPVGLGDLAYTELVLFGP